MQILWVNDGQLSRFVFTIIRFQSLSILHHCFDVLLLWYAMVLGKWLPNAPSHGPKVNRVPSFGLEHRESHAKTYKPGRSCFIQLFSAKFFTYSVFQCTSSHVLGMRPWLVGLRSQALPGDMLWCFHAEKHLSRKHSEIPGFLDFSTCNAIYFNIDAILMYVMNSWNLINHAGQQRLTLQSARNYFWMLLDIWGIGWESTGCSKNRSVPTRILVYKASCLGQEHLNKSLKWRHSTCEHTRTYVYSRVCVDHWNINMYNQYTYIQVSIYVHVNDRTYLHASTDWASPLCPDYFWGSPTCDMTQGRRSSFDRPAPGWRTSRLAQWRPRGEPWGQTPCADVQRMSQCAPLRR